MVIIDPIRMDVLRKVFPEINDTKIEILTLFAFGMSSRDISSYRNTKPQAVHKALRELCALYGVASQDALKAAYAARLTLYTSINLSIEVIRED